VDAARFQRQRKLGEGGMGVVWEAFDQKLRTRVALKTLRTLSPDAVLRLKNEFRALQDLHHENLIALGELFEADGEWFFTMELVEGVDFLSYVRHSSSSSDEQHTMEGRVHTASWDGASELDVPLPVVQAKPFFDEKRLRETLTQIARGLQALHVSGMVHRDIKPSNILVTEGGRVRILDFGLIASAGGAEADGRMVGTLWYMAPEQASGKPIGAAADWYALGVLIYEALAGRLPYHGPNARAVLDAKLNVDAEPPHQLAAGVPSDLEELCLKLLARDPAARPSSEEVLRWLGEEPLSTAPKLPFVGRRSELSRLESAAPGRTLVISGESGVGKSALLRRFVESRDDCVLLQGRCYERESVPYKAIDGVVDAASRFLARLPASQAAELQPQRASALAKLFPVLEWTAPDELDRRAERSEARSLRGGRAAEDAREEIEPRVLRAHAVDALVELFGKLAAHRRVVITIEDFHWADADSLELLSAVMREPPPLLLILTMRSDGELPALLGPVEHIHLEKLPQEDAALLAQSLIGEGERARLLAEEAQGHPLFIAELARAGQRDAPLRLDEALYARVARLDDRARELLEALSVAARPMGLPTAAHLLGLEPVELGRLAGRLRTAHLLRSDSALEPYHDRIRAAINAHLSPARLTELHRRVAQALEATQSGEPETLAIHWHGADDLPAAARYAAEAADRAAEALAFARAARLYRMAIEWGGSTFGDRRRRLLVRLGEALANDGRSVAAAEAFRDAAVGAPEEEALELERRSAQQFLSGGRIDEGMAAIHSVLAAVGLALPKTPQRALLSLLAARARLALRGLDFTTRSERELDRIVRMRIDATYAISLTLGTVDTIRGTDYQTRNLLYALDAGEPYRIARALLLEASFRSLPGPSVKRRVDDLLARAERLARDLNHPQLTAWTHLSRGYIQFLWGRFGQGLPEFLDAERIFREQCRDVSYEIGSIKLFALWSRFYLGHIEEILEQLPEAIADAESRGDVSAAANLGSRVSHLCALAGDDPERARTQTEHALASWSQRGFYAQHYYALYAHAQIDLYSGQPALKRLRDSWRALEKSLLFRVQFIHAEALHLRARAALQAGDKALARKDARAILKMKLDWATPLAELILAALENDTGIMDRAIAGLERAGLALYAEAARRRRVRSDAAWPGIRNPERIVDTLVPR
jgi:serine/threonine protein kinase